MSEKPHRVGDHFSWTFGASAWSGWEFGDDMLKIRYDAATGEWRGYTEADQCIRRDLDDDEIVSVVKEFDLEVPAMDVSRRPGF